MQYCVYVLILQGDRVLMTSEGRLPSADVRFDLNKIHLPEEAAAKALGNLDVLGGPTGPLDQRRLVPVYSGFDESRGEFGIVYLCVAPSLRAWEEGLEKVGEWRPVSTFMTSSSFLQRMANALNLSYWMLSQSMENREKQDAEGSDEKKEPAQSEFDRGYRDGRYDRGYRPSSPRYVEGYKSGNLTAIRLNQGRKDDE